MIRVAVSLTGRGKAKKLLIGSRRRFERMAELPLTGGCLCGSVRYEITKPLVSAGY